MPLKKYSRSKGKQIPRTKPGSPYPGKTVCVHVSSELAIGGGEAQLSQGKGNSNKQLELKNLPKSYSCRKDLKEDLIFSRPARPKSTCTKPNRGFQNIKNSMSAWEQSSQEELLGHTPSRKAVKSPRMDNNRYLNVQLDQSETSSQESAITENVRREQEVSSQGLHSPIKPVTVQTAKDWPPSPTIVYATYWTQPINALRLSSTYRNESSEFNILEGLPGPGLSTINELTLAHTKDEEELCSLSDSKYRPASDSDAQESVLTVVERQFPGVHVSTVSPRCSPVPAILDDFIPGTPDGPKTVHARLTSTPQSAKHVVETLNLSSVHGSEEEDSELFCNASRFVNSTEITVSDSEEEKLQPCFLERFAADDNFLPPIQPVRRRYWLNDEPLCSSTKDVLMDSF